MHKTTIGYWLLRIIPALIMGQTLFYKFSAHPESVTLFTSLGMEPTGRRAIGLLELLACLLLLFGKKHHGFGALLGCGLMAGALYFHLTILGINTLFWLAVITFLCCCSIVRHERNEMRSQLFRTKQ